MALQLTDVIRGVRDVHPAFHRSRVPDAVLARNLTGLQRELAGKMLLADPSALAQQVSVGFAFSSSNAAGTVGAGTGQRAIDATVGVLSAVDAPVGTAVEVDVSGSDVVTLVSESVVASATSTTLTKTAAGWTTNAYTNNTVVITAGRGAGQRRTISSNTATVLTVSQAWTTTPDSTSLFTVVDEVMEADETFGAVFDGPFTTTRYGYGVKVNASGTAYVDFTTPLVAQVDAGIPMPPMQALVGGTVRLSDGETTLPLTLVDYLSRLAPHGAFAAYQMNQQLFLCGGESDWQDVASLDLRYVPIPPALTALTDYFLLPDSAYPALVAGAAYASAVRVQGMPDVPPIDINALAVGKAESERAWLRAMGTDKRRRRSVIHDWDGY